MKYLIATCGITHSGKSTFGENIKLHRADLPVIDSDLIHSTMCQLIPQVKEVERTRTDISPKKPRLRHIILQETIKYFFRNNVSVVCTNGNTDQNARTILRNLAHDHDAQFILVYFNLPLSTIKKRINHSKRPLDILIKSKDFNEVLARQIETFEPPLPTEADIFYEVQDSEDADTVMRKILSATSCTYGAYMDK
jgi:predicted kinase